MNTVVVTADEFYDLYFKQASWSFLGLAPEGDAIIENVISEIINASPLAGRIQLRSTWLGDEENAEDGEESSYREYYVIGDEEEPAFVCFYDDEMSFDAKSASLEWRELVREILITIDKYIRNETGDLEYVINVGFPSGILFSPHVSGDFTYTDKLAPNTLLTEAEAVKRVGGTYSTDTETDVTKDDSEAESDEQHDNDDPDGEHEDHDHKQKFVKPVEIRVITVPQPWAWAIFNLGLDVLNASSDIVGNYDGVLAIHAGEGFDEMYILHPAVAGLYERFPAPDEYEHNKILGTTRMGSFDPAIISLKPSEWAGDDANYWLTLTDPRLLDAPIDFSDGQTGVRELSEEIQLVLREANYPPVMPPTEIIVGDGIVVMLSGAISKIDVDVQAHELIEQIKAVQAKAIEDGEEPKELDLDAMETELKIGMRKAMADFEEKVKAERDALAAERGSAQVF